VGLSERNLVRRLRKGDREACRELIRRHHQGVYGYLRRLGAQPSRAEDLTQETYAKAWRRIETLRDAASLRAWLLTIARNEFFQRLRVARPDAEGCEDLPEIEDPDPGAENAMIDSERDRRLRRAVGRLEPTLQEAVALHYFQDLSFRETGSVLGIPAGTVKSRIHRALGELRALLEQTEADHERQRAEEAAAGPS